MGQGEAKWLCNGHICQCRPNGFSRSQRANGPVAGRELLLSGALYLTGSIHTSLTKATELQCKSMNFVSWLCRKGKAVMSLPAGHLTALGSSLCCESLPQAWLCLMRAKTTHSEAPREKVCAAGSNRTDSRSTQLSAYGFPQVQVQPLSPSSQDQGLWGPTGCLDSSRTLPNGLVCETATLHAPAFGKDQR